MSLEENYYDVNITLGVAYVVDTLNIKDIKDEYIGQYLEPALFSQIMGCSQIEAKRIIIKWSCTGTNELLYEGNFMCRFSAPYDDFYNVCLNDLMDRLI